MKQTTDAQMLATLPHRSHAVPLAAMVVMVATSCYPAPSPPVPSPPPSTFDVEDAGRGLTSTALPPSPAASQVSPKTELAAPSATSGEGLGCRKAEEREDHPVINLNQPISAQIELYGGDSVEIVASDRDPDAVRFGPNWEAFVPGHVYVVWAPDGVPFYPSFQGRTTGMKLLVRYSCNTDKKRDVRRRDPTSPIWKK
jgi:hypothetical protein